MLDPRAFDPAPPQTLTPSQEGVFGPDRRRRRKPVNLTAQDSGDLSSARPDGYPVDKWDRMSDSSRRAVLGALNALTQRAVDQNKAPSAPGASKFTTQYAIDWGKRQGWRLISRETWTRHNGRARSHDVDFGMDAVMMDRTGNRYGIQGAGRGEEAPHYQRFLERAAIKETRNRFGTLIEPGLSALEVCKAQNLRIFYLEFERGNPNPIKQKEWTASTGTSE